MSAMVAVVDYPDTGRLVRRYVRCNARRADGATCQTVLFVYLIPPMPHERELHLPCAPIEAVCPDRRCRKVHTIYVPASIVRLKD